jgi:hypothetical protein
MRTAQTILVLATALLLVGCPLRKQSAAKNLPPAPQPVTKPAEPAPPPAQLSVPQTQVELPPPQPVSPDAVAAAQLPAGEPVEPPSAPPRNPSRRRSAASAPSAPKPEPEVAAPPATPPPAENATPIQEILPPSEQKRYQETADNQKREIRQWLDQARARRLNRTEAGRKKTIESLVKLSDQAEALGDMRQAAEIAERAWILAKDLQSGR